MDLFQISYSNYAARTANSATAIGSVAVSMTPDSGIPSIRHHGPSSAIPSTRPTLTASIPPALHPNGGNTTPPKKPTAPS
ncbi:hypothetical protein BDV28DRAFT_137082 [Aspergillus coremiiformis]|uniref:Uncharacterized protein n=1 Tax=Aspergillus coremiiformis TaxID=138285 RepID=A0A5N6Z184_9EURO|nr:hypothetical protein BDV28DRAFT_137082 [Aspergillus coremiiformis]